MSDAVGSARARSVAIRILRWYPRPWRRRYQAEMQALLEQMPVRWHQVANLAAIGVREWWSPRALGWPARSAAGRVQVSRGLTYVACAFALDGIARIVASKLSGAEFVTSDTFTTIVGMCMVALPIRMIVAGIRYRRHEKAYPSAPERQRPGRMLGWEIALWAVLMFPWLVIRHAEPTPTYLNHTMLTIRPYMDLLQVWMWANMTLQASARTKRLRRVQSSWMKRQLGDRPTHPFLQ